MIKGIRLEGFQSHVNSYINLGPGLNVITGPSGSGKTTIIRIVKWIAFNEPAGEAFVNEKVGEAVGTIYLDSGVIITKRRRKGKTSYLLQLDEGDEGSLYEKSEVPEEVKQHLQILKQTFGDFEAALNFSFQLDPPFLLSETPSAGSKILGKLAGTESVDMAIKGVSKDTYGSRQDRTSAEKDIERIAASMLEYAQIDDAKEAVEVAEMLLTQIEAGDKKLGSMKEYRQAYEAALNTLNLVATKLDKLAVVPSLAADLEDIEKAQRRYDLLLDLYGTYDRLCGRVDDLARDLLSYLEVGLASEILEEAENQAGRVTLISSIALEYQKYTDVYRKSESTLERLQGLEGVAEGITAVEAQLSALSDLRIMKAEYTQALKRTELVTERLEVLEAINGAESILNSLDRILDSLATMQQLKRGYDSAKVNLEKHDNWIKLADGELQKAQLEIAAAWDAAGGICPMCDQPHEGGKC